MMVIIKILVSTDGLYHQNAFLWTFWNRLQKLHGPPAETKRHLTAIRVDSPEHRSAPVLGEWRLHKTKFPET